MEPATTQHHVVLHSAADGCLEAAVNYFLNQQKEDFHWCAELDSDPSNTAQYVFVHQALQLDARLDRPGLTRWFLANQKEDGSYGVAVDYPGNTSITCEAYLALKILGLPAEHPAQLKACTYVRQHGGMESVRIFTRIFFAAFGLFDWRATPAMPPELIFMPAGSPVNIYAMSYWARSTLVPFLIMGHHRPVFALPNGRSADNSFVDELWLDPTCKSVPYLPSLRQTLAEGGGWKTFFTLADHFLKAYERWHIRPLRRLALQRCTQWILDHQEPEGDWGGIAPPMLNNLMALPLQGYNVDTSPVRRGLAAMDRFVWRDSAGVRMQSCVSAVWDTVLGLIALCDAGVPPDDPRLRGAAQWLLARQICERRGDWAVTRPHLQPGGWAFEYFNTWFPDVDDTAAILIALVKQDPTWLSQASATRAIEWMLGMGNQDGGWASFDADNDHLYLNEAPVADMKALCDPSTADVTGRIIEALGLLLRADDDVRALAPDLRRRMEDGCRRGTAFLQRTQEASGAWFGRWGVNYLYGTCHALCGLGSLPWPAPAPMVAAALHWFKKAQNRDGGWGEGLASYDDPGLAGQGASTASQTAWALMGLLAHLPASDPAIAAGIAWLVDNQASAAQDAGTWHEPQTTGVGFPQHVYIRYDLYRHYFPMMALGRYLNASRFAASP